MNLLQEIRKKPKDPNDTGINTDTFRAYQYSLIPYFCDLMVNFISQQNGYFLSINDKGFYDKVNYIGIYNSQVSEMFINITRDDNPSEVKTFFSLLIPTLIDDVLFFLNGNYYVPSMYVIDLPIVLKKNSLKLTGLFNSVTIYIKEDFAIFTGKNIPLYYLLQLLLYDDEGKDIYDQFKEKYPKHNATECSEENIVNYFGTIFKPFNNRTEVIDYINRLFLDEYTKSLYESCYSELSTVDICSIIKCAIKKNINKEIPNFINLNFKRLVFLEPLLRPLIEKVAGAAISCARGYKTDLISISNISVVKHFLTSPDNDQNKTKKGLSGNYIYNDVNLYTSILKNKISMVPIGIENAPKEVQSIHQSHYGRICPISISSQKPGQVVSVIPGTKLDYFGRFI